ncbi:MAG TPA: extracellular solute-binding protein [Candidatus Limnocylindrales bacterium]
MNRRLVALAATLMIAGAACGGSTSTASPAASQAASQPAASQPAASTAPSEAPSAAAAPVTLTLWHNYGTEANASVTDALVKAYMAKNPNVTIEVVSQPADNYFALLKAAAVASSGPDLMTMWTGLFALQNQTYLEPLNQYIPADTLKSFNGIDWCSKGLSLDQGAICVPLDMQHYNGFYNKDLFAKAGITSFPTNWTEFLAACEKLKAAGILPLAYGPGGQALNAGFYPYYDLSYMMMYLPVADWKKLYSGEIPWTDPAIVAQLTKWATLKSNGYTNPDVLNGDSVAMFEAGQAAMTLEGSWDYKEFHDKLGASVGVFVPPFTDTQAKGVVEFPGNGFGVTSYSQHKAEAAAFLAWMATPEAQQIIAAGGLIPVVPGTAATEPLANAMLDFAANQGYTRYPMIDNVIQPEVTDVATKVLNAVFAGTMSPADATKAMSDALNALPADRRGSTYTAPTAGG